MKIRYMIIAVLCLFFAAGATAQEKAPAGKAPMAYAAFFKKGMEKTEGSLPVYQQGDKYYMEIPDSLLGRDFLFTAQAVRGTGGNGVFTKSPGVASFRKFEGHKLALYRDLMTERVSDDGGAVLADELLQPVDYLYPIVAYGTDQKSPIIDVTALVKNGKDWFTLARFAAGSEARESFINGVEKVKDGMKFNVMRVHNFGANPRPGQKGYVPAEIDFTLRVLPREKMQVRLADPRVGYQSLDYREYDLSSGDVRKVSVIQRWNVEKEPLVFTLAPYIPDWIRPAIVEGITAWQGAFAEAGLKDVLQVRMADSTEDLSQLRALVTFSTLESRVSSSVITDPRTGEILSCRLNVPHSTPANLLVDYMLQCGATDPRILANPNDPEIVRELVRWQVSREVGRVLGLEENRAGSAAYSTKQLRDKDWLAKYGCTASVMDDCPFNYIAQPEDEVNPRDLVARVGEYDRWAIRYGYTPQSGNPREVKRALAPILAMAADQPALRYLATDANNPYTQFKDLASDKVKAAEYGMKNLERMMPYLEALTGVKDGENWNTLTGAWLKISNMYKQYVKDVITLIGGEIKVPVLRGYNEIPLRYVPKQEQKVAMEFLNRYLFSGVPAWMDYSVAERNGLMTGKDVVDAAVSETFTALFKKDRIERLIAAEKADRKGNYGMTDLFADLDRMLYHDFDGSVKGAYARKLQQKYTASWMGAAVMGEVNTLQDDYAVATLSQLTNHRKQIERLSRTHANAAERGLYRMLVVVLDRAIEMDGKALKSALMDALKR